MPPSAPDVTNSVQVIQREKGYIPYLSDAVLIHLTSLPPVQLQYTIRVDKDFHESPTPTIYDIQVQVDDPLKDALSNYITNPAYATNLREIATLNDHLAILVQRISNSKSKHAFFDALSKHPTDFISKWLSSQQRDLEVISGENLRANGGGEDAYGDEWRWGGANGIWASDDVKESVKLLVNQKR